MYHFCTYFDSNYLINGILLYNSLKGTCNNFILYVLCLDDQCYDNLASMNCECLIPIRLNDFEAQNQELLNIKSNRNRIEYYFTITPFLPDHILRVNKDIDIISYIDADLFFFSDPAMIIKEIGHNSVAIIPHNFPLPLKHLEKYGKYNVGLMSFRNDRNGRNCLEWYKEKCIEWCYDFYEEGKFADQKYLDYFSEYFGGVIELKNKGLNLAPWNIDNYHITIKNNQIMVDDEILIFYHFHGLRKIWFRIWDLSFVDYNSKINKVIKNSIYRNYIDTYIYTKKNLEHAIGLKNVNYSIIRRGNTKSGMLFSYLFPYFYSVFKKSKRIIRIIINNSFLWR